MAYDTAIFQGRFTSTGTRSQIDFRSDIDWMEVINGTVAAAGGAGTGVKFLWQRGFGDDSGFIYTKLAADDSIALGVMANGGFTLVDTSDQTLGALNATVTTISGAAPPLVSAASTAGLANNDVVRILNVPGAQQFGGIDFTIGNLVANTQFELTYAPTIVTTGVVAGGTLRRVPFDPIYYPRRRYISAITQAATAVVTLTVTHGFTVGQVVRFEVPAAFDMTEINGLTGTVTAINAVTNTVTVDIDSSAFTAFAWPLTADVPFTPAQLVPVGEDSTSTAGITLDDATFNDAVLSMLLAAGANSPAGTVGDVIYWRAGKSFSVNNV